MSLPKPKKYAATFFLKPGGEEKMIQLIIAAAIGFVVGAFTPAVGRTIKAWFVKETTAAKTAAVADAKKL